jgi:hypothetical protein
MIMAMMTKAERQVMGSERHAITITNRRAQSFVPAKLTNVTFSPELTQLARVLTGIGDAFSKANAMKRPMSHLDIDRKHNEAIREEIAERLRGLLREQAVPPRIRKLVRQIGEARAQDISAQLDLRIARLRRGLLSKGRR